MVAEQFLNIKRPRQKVMKHCMAIILINVLFYTIASFLFLSPFSLAEVKNDGFSIDLIHIDSVISPKRNSSTTEWDHVNNAVLRSERRANGLRFKILFATLERDMAADGDFFVRLSIGTPSFEIIGLADMGGGLPWTQCMPCAHCYQQKPPLFAPNKSSTYKELPSNTRLCIFLGGRTSLFGDKPCGYNLSYSDGSYSYGVISSDTVTLNSGLGSSVSKQNIFFGCGSKNQGHFNEESTGVIGFGGGSGSLITQMKDVISRKFSYCLVPHEKNNSMPSKMHFGSKALVSGPGTVFTGLHIFRDTLYAVRFKGLSVGNKKLTMTNTSSKFLGYFNDRITIETGTILTHLPRRYYKSLELAIRNGMRLQSVVDPKGKLKVCYRSKNDDIKAPIVTLHFVGADVKLNSANTFVKVAEDVHCLGIVPHDGVAILGNLAQKNFLVGFDLNRKFVSFKPTDCSKM